MHWKRQTLQRGLKRWSSWVERRSEAREVQAEAWDWARERGEGRALRLWAARVKALTGRKERGELARRAWVAGWLGKWRCWTAKRLITAGEMGRLQAGRQRARVFRALYRWRAAADERGVRRAVLGSKATAGCRALSRLWTRRALEGWVEWGRTRAIKRLATLRARARFEGRLLRAVYSGWAVVARAQAREKRELRAAARVRVRGWGKRGLAALKRWVRLREHALAQQAGALWTWKLSLERRVWRAWRVGARAVPSLPSMGEAGWRLTP